LTNHLYLVSKLRVWGAIPPFLNMSSWHVA
jgi:hypothetical protein